jgi:hypothetical protein
VVVVVVLLWAGAVAESVVVVVVCDDDALGDCEVVVVVDDSCANTEIVIAAAIASVSSKLRMLKLLDVHLDELEGAELLLASRMLTGAKKAGCRQRQVKQPECY